MLTIPALQTNKAEAAGKRSLGVPGQSGLRARLVSKNSQINTTNSQRCVLSPDAVSCVTLWTASAGGYEKRRCGTPVYCQDRVQSTTHSSKVGGSRRQGVGGLRGMQGGPEQTCVSLISRSSLFLLFFVCTRLGIYSYCLGTSMTLLEHLAILAN